MLGVVLTVCFQRPFENIILQKKEFDLFEHVKIIVWFSPQKFLKKSKK